MAKRCSRGRLGESLLCSRAEVMAETPGERGLKSGQLSGVGVLVCFECAGQVKSSKIIVFCCIVEDYENQHLKKNLTVS
ncbi:hypothetical protein NPIL_362301 [Nephila pilipes]|uniref:Uncharacterized protein n=1 Tax=Nephila pilipes TaxID=299642 RepID=A0A8X6MY13_NEPPI|nr:hypothetical protein NPIL_362301 [Nephila pilipes]